MYDLTFFTVFIRLYLNIAIFNSNLKDFDTVFCLLLYTKRLTRFTTEFNLNSFGNNKVEITKQYRLHCKRYLRERQPLIRKYKEILSNRKHIRMKDLFMSEKLFAGCINIRLCFYIQL